MKPWRSEKYLAWVRSQDCCVCRFPGHLGSNVAHHVIGNGFGGMGTKSTDAMAMPLCPTCHSEVHKDYEFLNQEREALNALHLALKEQIIIVNQHHRE